MDKWLNHPTSLRIISLVIGILLWAVVHFDSDQPPNTVASLTETRDIEDVKVQAVGLDEKNFALRGIEPSVVTLTVRGPRSALVFATPDDFQVTVDVSHAVEGKQQLPVNVSFRRAFDSVSVEPRTVSVELERMVTKEYEVQVTAEGEPANGYKLGEPILKPNNRVHVTLPADRMDQVGYVGANISVEGEENTVSNKKLKVLVLDKNGNEMNDAVVNPSVVEVEVPITKPFKKVPLQIGFAGEMPSGLAVSSFKSSIDQVTIYGPQDMLDKIDFYDGLSIDLSRLTQSGTMELAIPPERGIASVDPSKVTIDYTVVPAVSKVLSQLKVNLIGLSDGLKAKLAMPADGTIDVPVKGAPNVLGDVSAQDVQLIADLSGLGPGSHVVPLDIHLPRFVEMDTESPLSVTVEITDSAAANAQSAGQPLAGAPDQVVPDQGNKAAQSGDAQQNGASQEGQTSGVDPSGQSSTNDAQKQSAASETGSGGLKQPDAGG